jgi:hypothetical protein
VPHLVIRIPRYILSFWEQFRYPYIEVSLYLSAGPDQTTKHLASSACFTVSNASRGPLHQDAFFKACTTESGLLSLGLSWHGLLPAPGPRPRPRPRPNLSSRRDAAGRIRLGRRRGVAREAHGRGESERQAYQNQLRGDEDEDGSWIHIHASGKVAENSVEPGQQLLYSNC